MSDFTENGIDISHWNIVKDFNKVKASGVDFVILKAGGSDKGFYKDRCFEDYYRLAKLSGLKVGAYYYVGKNFFLYEAGVLDAKRFLNITREKDFDYPLVVDVEEMQAGLRNEVTEATIGFCETLEKEGKYAMIYSADIAGYKERLHIDYLTPYDKWVARWGRKPTYVKSYGIWQKSSKGQVPGILGNVDLNVSYKDYKVIMEKHNLNRR